MNIRPYRDVQAVIGRRVWIDPAAAVEAHALSAPEIAMLAESAAHYVALKDDYLKRG